MVRTLILIEMANDPIQHIEVVQVGTIVVAVKNSDMIDMTIGPTSHAARRQRAEQQSGRDRQAMLLELWMGVPRPDGSI